MQRNWNSLCTVDGNVNRYSHCKKNSMKVPQNFKIKLPCDQHSHFGLYIQRKLNQDLEETVTPLCPLQHYSQQPRYGNHLNAHWFGQLDKQNVVYTYNGIFFTLKKEILPFATTWTNLEDIILSEISQTQNDIYCLILLI